MSKKFYILISISFALTFTKVCSQTLFGNEWINFASGQKYSSQQYFKIPVVEDGLYRISYSEMTKAGIPASQIFPDEVQIFFKGVEQSIFIKHLTSGKFIPGDYIEFFGRKNDGWYDKNLYKDKYGNPAPSGQVNPYYSLSTDTSMYFFTWKPGSSGNKRMILETDTSFAGKTPLTYFNTEVRNIFTNHYAEGETYASDKISSPDYVIAEGWVSDIIGLGSSLSQPLLHPNAYTAGPAATINTVVVGAGDAPFYGKNHHTKINLNNVTLWDTLFWGYDMLKLQTQISAAQLSAASSPLSISSMGQPGLSIDNIAVSYANLKYPHTLNFSGENAAAYSMIIENTLQTKEFLDLSNFNTNGTSPILLCFSNDTIRRIPLLTQGSQIRGLVPVTGIANECFLSSESQVKSTGLIRAVGNDPVNFARFTNFEANGINMDFVMIGHKKLMNAVNLYRLYRSGKNQVLVADISELYEQFGYGIEHHPLSIRNFCAFLLKKSNPSTQPKYLFLVGKGLENYDGQKVRKDPQLFSANLIPPYGYPGSDNLYTAGLDTTLHEPALATGRLSAKSNIEVEGYLNKIIAFEQQPIDEWMKNVLHFGGGANAGEQESIKGVMNTWADTVQGPHFGGHVTSFFKTNDDPIQPVVNSNLHALIDNGVSMITFFGHAYNSGFDQDIDLPSNYKNYGKYPLILANSCLIGDMFLSNNASTSESYVLLPGLGSIGFIASTTYGFPSPLAAYSTELYKHIFRASYGKSIGNSMKNTIAHFNPYFSSDHILRYTCHEMTLHGDPSMVLNSFQKPDYVMKPERIYFTPATITSDMPNFSLHVICSNQGKASTDSFYVQVKRTYPGGVDSLYAIKVPPVLYRDTFHLVLPTGSDAEGLNTISVNLDYTNQIAEELESNNSASATLLIKSNAINPVYPPKFAIIPKNNVTLKASTDDPFAPVRSYVFVMDTSDAFKPSSPSYRTGMVTQSGGVVSWNPAITLKDSTVYYWRVSLKDSLRYRESSFIYIPGKTGWSQAHFNQFKNDNYNNIIDLQAKRKFDFIDEMKVFKVQTNWRNANEFFYVNNFLIKFGSWGNVNVAIINPNTATLMENPIGGSYGTQPQSGSSSVVPTYTFDYALGQASQDSMVNLINHVAADSSYILVYSTHGIGGTSYSTSVFQNNVRKTLAGIGADTSILFSAQNNLPFIIFGKKGWKPGRARINMGLGGNDIITRSDTLIIKWKSGSIASEPIGPAKTWTTLHWRIRPYPGEAGLTNRDSAKLDLYGINNKGVEKRILKNISPSVSTYNLSFIDADSIPYLRLKTNMGDDSLRTVPQLNRWQIYYDGVPEAALNPSKYFNFYNSTLEEGDTMHFAAAIENISEYDMDSMLINFWVVDKERKNNLIPFKRQKKLLAAGKSPQDTIIARVSWPTKQHPGLNKLWIEANPNNDQKEQYHFNNIGLYSFHVNDDKTSPILDVTFDAVHILDGDIVSGKPDIFIKLLDENKYLMLKDTSLFTLQLKTPLGNSYRLHFNKSPYEQSAPDLLSWYPATSADKNNFRIQYHPILNEDGKYELLVQASDASKNQSGRLDYKISFEVINKPSITEMLNYPNPFSTSTHFVFTLTGTELPTHMKIQIMTITGKVVREIMQEELGSIHIGRNITDYAWDGKDEYGDKLANGVYFYRVISSLHDRIMDVRGSGADKYFNKGFGKMYIMR